MNKIITKINTCFSSERLIQQLVSLTLTTGYYEYACTNNKLGFDVHEAVKIKLVIPYLPYTNMILDDLNNVAGVYVGLTKQEEVDHITFGYDWLRDDLDLQMMINAIDNVYHSIPNDHYMLHQFAVRFDLQGINHPQFSRKISDLLFENLLFAVRESKTDSLSLMVWESHVPAVKVYTRYGAKIVRKINISNKVVSDCLLLMNITL